MEPFLASRPRLVGCRRTEYLVNTDQSRSSNSSVLSIQHATAYNTVDDRPESQQLALLGQAQARSGQRDHALRSLRPHRFSPLLTKNQFSTANFPIFAMKFLDFGLVVFRSPDLVREHARQAIQSSAVSMLSPALDGFGAWLQSLAPSCLQRSASSATVSL